MALQHFTTLVYDYNTQFGDTPLTPYIQGFNPNWVEFHPVNANDTAKYNAGVRAQILNYPGGAAAHPRVYFSHHTVEELAAIANGGTNS